MELVLTDEQKLLRDSAATMVERAGGADRVRARRDAGGALDRPSWDEIAAAGWLAMLPSEEAGGLGLGMTELALVLEQCGRALMQAPVCAAAAAAKATGEGDSAAIRDDLTASIMAGERLVVPALAESAGGSGAEEIETRAEADGDGLRLTGAKIAVPDATDADGFLIPARGPQGISLCYLPRDAKGLTVVSRRTVDGGAVADIRLDGAPVPQGQIVAGPNRASALISAMHDTMLVGLGAELLGVMGQALDIALEYLKIRNQFDRPIGSFQALQHRSVNDYVEVELIRSFLFQVCAAVDDGRGSPSMCAALKARASEGAMKVTKSAIQMHGGIGFTDEHDIGFYLKRAMALSAQYGNAAVQRRRYAALVEAGDSQ